MTNDKRMMVFEDELSAPLRVMSRFGNTLSTTLRSGWDGRPLQVMTRQEPLRATGAHISIIAQTTQHDLERYLGLTDVFNGFANRFLWGCVQRSKLLPDGGGIREEALTALARKLKQRVKFARRQSRIGLSTNAAQMWKQIYAEISIDEPGSYGAAVSRAEAQVRRIALIYALLDQSCKVRTAHLLAAVEVWRFCRDSAQFIFGGRVATTLEDRILSALTHTQGWSTRSEISQALHHHEQAAAISRALHELKERGLVRTKTIKTKGRSAEYWKAI